MRKICLLWYGIFIGTNSLKAKRNQENDEKMFKKMFSFMENFLSIIKDKWKFDGKTDDNLILPEDTISLKFTESKTIKN